MDALELKIFDKEELAFLRYLEDEEKYERREEKKGIPKYSRKKHPCSWSFYQRYHDGKLQGDIFAVDANLGMGLKKDGHMEKIDRKVSPYLEQPIRYVWENIKVPTRKGIYDEFPNLYRFLSNKKFLKFFAKN